jgi:predicted Ser/Thr protein kinase
LRDRKIEIYIENTELFEQKYVSINNIKKNKVLGEGGQGKVYKFDYNGKFLAIKISYGGYKKNFEKYYE